MISASHPSATGGLQSNLITGGNADLSESALEQVITDIMRAKDTNGKQIILKPKKLFVNSANWAEANRILKSSLRSGTSDNDVNALKDMRLEIVLSPYLTDEDAFYVLNDFAPGEGLVHFVADSLSVEQDYDTNRKVTNFIGYESYAFNYLDWRCVYGTAGA
jgi:hypothetical protein